MRHNNTGMIWNQPEEIFVVTRTDRRDGADRASYLRAGGTWSRDIEEAERLPLPEAYRAAAEKAELNNGVRVKRVVERSKVTVTTTFTAEAL